MILDFEKNFLFMGILNLTPNSFSDGGAFLDSKKALNRISELQRDGADIIDIGAQSSASKKTQVTTDEEWRRLEPVLKKIDYTKTFVSVDTYRSDVAGKALNLGVQMINDVTGLRGDPKMIDVLCQYQPYVCLMYSAYDTPYAGNEEKHFTDIMAVIKAFLQRQTQSLLSRGFPREKIIIDPGLGRFLSNDPAVSWEVIERLAELKELGFPILVGPSRKSFLSGSMASRDKKTAEVCRKAIKHGASILRVHSLSFRAGLRVEESL